MAAPTDRDSDKFVLRLPDGMRDRIKSAADQNNRSMNAEIVAALEAAFPIPNELRRAALSLAYLAENYPDMQRNARMRKEMAQTMLELTNQIAAMVKDTEPKP